MAFLVGFGTSTQRLDVPISNTLERPLLCLSQCNESSAICGMNSEPYFTANVSSTWHDQMPGRLLYEEQSLDGLIAGIIGTDTIHSLVQKGSATFSIESQSIGVSRDLAPGNYAISNAGLLGIRPHSNQTLETYPSRRSLLYPLKQNGHTRSLSWGYGAAAVYNYEIMVRHPAAR